MATWAGRRKFIYAVIVIIVAVFLIGWPVYNLFYEAPSCVDNKQNGDEQGIDCGGSCTKLCQNNFLSLPAASWVRYKEVAPNVYNIAAYVVNPNKNAAAKKVPYRFSVLDRNGFQIAEAKGTFDVPAGRNTMIFRPAVTIKDQEPARAVVEFSNNPEWSIASDSLRSLSVTDKDYSENESGSSLEARLRNGGAVGLSDIVVFAILKDGDGNVIDFSKTIVDRLGPSASAVAPFTWPASHGGRVISIEVLAVPE